MNSTSASPPDIQTTFGVLYISTLICMVLIGITTLQAWFYFLNHPDDRIATKLTVAVVWCTECIRCAFLAHASYYYVVWGWGNPTALFSPTWSMATLPLMTNIGEMIVQLYFAWRVCILSRGTFFRWILTFSIVAPSVCFFSMGIAVYTLGLNSISWADYIDGSQKTLTPATLSVSMATNLLIMLSLIFLLRRFKPELPRTHHIINTLMFYTIQAGALIVVVDAAVIALDTYIKNVGFAYIGLFSMQGNRTVCEFIVSQVRSFVR
ncbi:hypothetical protein BDY19DRAFT_746313 [Irpex rosettiformis]|uniref:Uncharacterized protein n=1 Tax=Irpex rosettiformis TaxID=378272 RepID=A0ACB8TMG4_9APHY|nr:hypothetical protein BDY19DRAFT_746313 [Irpex rosettiformis]